MPAFDKKHEEHKDPFQPVPQPAAADKKAVDAAAPAGAPVDLSMMSWLYSVGFLNSALMAAMNRSDGMTTQDRSASAGWKGGPTVDLKSERKTEVDENHNMNSTIHAGYVDKTVFVETGKGGKILDSDGAQAAPASTRQPSIPRPMTKAARRKSTAASTTRRSCRTSCL